MFDAMSFAEIDGQHVELLPARTVLSLFATHGATGGEGGNGGGAQGGVGVNVLSGIGVLGTGSASAGDAAGGAVSGEQGQDSACGEQLHVLAIDLGEAHCVKHPQTSSLWAPCGPVQTHLIGS